MAQKCSDTISHIRVETRKNIDTPQKANGKLVFKKIFSTLFTPDLIDVKPPDQTLKFS